MREIVIAGCVLLLLLRMGLAVLRSWEDAADAAKGGWWSERPWSQQRVLQWLACSVISPIIVAIAILTPIGIAIIGIWEGPPVETHGC